MLCYTKVAKLINNVSVGILLFNILLILKLLFLSILIMLCGDAEINPGPKTISQQGFSVCHWNLNSIFLHNFAKICLLKAYVAIHKFDIIYLSGAYLDSIYLITMTIWISMGATWYALIIYQTLNVEEFVSIIETIYLCE